MAITDIDEDELYNQGTKNWLHRKTSIYMAIQIWRCTIINAYSFYF